MATHWVQPTILATHHCGGWRGPKGVCGATARAHLLVVDALPKGQGRWARFIAQVA